MTLASRLRQHLDRLLGEEDVTLPVGQNMLAVQTCFIPIHSPRRGYRIVRKGDHFTIHRVYPWWERIMLGGEFGATSDPVSYAGAFAAQAALLEVGLAHPLGGLDYCLVANLDHVRSASLLKGRIRVQGPARCALFFLGVLALVFPIVATTVALGLTLDRLPLTGADQSKTLWQACALLVVWAGAPLVCGLFAVLLVKIIARWRDRGQASKQALLHFVSVFAAASLGEMRS